ncbi:hypothetical protein JZK55_21260 [Dissulfurispira thermophila]|uniref:Uncharacterized protein n=2 Tax=root TaxID=1 RepID=A0A7G1H315_9BACT|nr:tetratricopeptide repeat protein [Dissulfurispira thermophila]BCB97204.1 hypothetical protein JZK55_21260 [Dissulfurispira thermophila]
MEDSIYIKRLKERLRQDPDSKVFLSLAEELRKQDKIDEAIAVLINGIKKHPDFIAARLTLGRWYLSIDMLSEAQKEYMEIIKQYPDNVFALKGLDEINKRLAIISGDNKELPVGSNKEIVIEHLNRFLKGIKTRFNVRDNRVNRLHRLLNAIKIHFAPSSENSV